MLRLFKYHAKYNKNNATYQFWQRNNMPVELITPKFIHQKIGYIHQNPVKAGIVANSQEYIYCSASNYVNGKGIIDVEIVDLGSTEGYIYMR